MWCHMEYEFLPNFCYICGRLGHVDKVCEVKLKEGEPKQFSAKLRYIPEKKWMGHEQENRGKKGERGLNAWRPSFFGNHSYKSGSGSLGSGGKSKSDSFGARRSKGIRRKKQGKDGDEVTSPLKLTGKKISDQVVNDTTRKKLSPEDAMPVETGDKSMFDVLSKKIVKSPEKPNASKNIESLGQTEEHNAMHIDRR